MQKWLKFHCLLTTWLGTHSISSHWVITILHSRLQRRFKASSLSNTIPNKEKLYGSRQRTLLGSSVEGKNFQYDTRGLTSLWLPSSLCSYCQRSTGPFVPKVFRFSLPSVPNIWQNIRGVRQEGHTFDGKNTD